MDIVNNLCHLKGFPTLPLQLIPTSGGSKWLNDATKQGLTAMSQRVVGDV